MMDLVIGILALLGVALVLKIASRKEEPSRSMRRIEIEPTEEKIDYKKIADKPIKEIKKMFKRKDIDPKKLLKVEKKNKNRKTLKKWLKGKM